MSKIKKYLNKIKDVNILWIVILTLMYITISTFIYGYPFNDIKEDFKVYQLALTAFAATVGLGTIVNSTISAKSSHKSMEISRKKDQRE